MQSLSDALKIEPDVLWACFIGELHPDEVIPPTPQHKRDALPIEWVETLYSIHDEKDSARVTRVLMALQARILAEWEEEEEAK